MLKIIQAKRVPFSLGLVIIMNVLFERPKSLILVVTRQDIICEFKEKARLNFSELDLTALDSPSSFLFDKDNMFDFNKEESMFIHFPNLDQFHFHYNTWSLDNPRCGIIRKDLFDGAASLIILNLARCNIKSIEKRAFEKLVNLKYLLLYDNPMDGQIVGKDLLYGLVNLISLNLSNCHIKSVENDAFNSLTKLENLDLHNNPNCIIKSRAFKSLSKLSYLAVCNTAFELDSDSDLVQLEKMSIDTEQLKFLQSLKRMDNIKEIDLRGYKC